MEKVLYKGEVIAEFKFREDAEYFLEWKRETIFHSNFNKLLDKIAMENHLDRESPGLIPLSIARPYYDKAIKQIEIDCRIEERSLLKKLSQKQDEVKEGCSPQKATNRETQGVR